jgi:hypothetical protein
MYWFLFNSFKSILNTREMNSRDQEILCEDEWAWQLWETRNYASYLIGICGRPKSSYITANLNNTRDTGLDSEMHPVVGFSINCVTTVGSSTTNSIPRLSCIIYRKKWILKITPSIPSYRHTECATVTNTTHIG